MICSRPWESQTLISVVGGTLCHCVKYWQQVAMWQYHAHKIIQISKNSSCPFSQLLAHRPSHPFQMLPYLGLWIAPQRPDQVPDPSSVNTMDPPYLAVVVIVYGFWVRRQKIRRSKAFRTKRHCKYRTGALGTSHQGRLLKDAHRQPTGSTTAGGLYLHTEPHIIQGTLYLEQAVSLKRGRGLTKSETVTKPAVITRRQCNSTHLYIPGVVKAGKKASFQSMTLDM